jgi:hypothetical protein
MLMLLDSIWLIEIASAEFRVSPKNMKLETVVVVVVVG